MRLALCSLLLASTALLAGCVDSGSSRYSDGYVRTGTYYRQPRVDIYRVPGYNETVRRPGYNRYDRYDRDRVERDRRDDRYSTDRRVRREAADRRAGEDSDRWSRYDRNNRDNDRNAPRDNGERVCEFPCVR
jgi:hypothetical protein